MAVTDLSDATFKADVLEADLPVLVDFWATWCGPCKMIAPLLDELAEEFGGKVVIGKVDVDQNPGVTGQFGVRGVPTLMLFKGGNLVATKVGPGPKGQLREFIETAL